VRSFDAASKAGKRSPFQVSEAHSDGVKCKLVVFASERPTLKTFEPVDDNGQKRLVSDAIRRCVASQRPVLKLDPQPLGIANGRGDVIDVVRAAAARFIASLDSQLVVAAINLVCRNLSHAILSNKFHFLKKLRFGFQGRLEYADVGAAMFKDDPEIGFGNMPTVSPGKPSARSR
jgi:hypothetical protein